MPTNYIKNLGQKNFDEICDKFQNVIAQNKPVWRGTVYIGEKPLYIECNVKWLAEKIPLYFVKTIENTKINDSKELYILNYGVYKFVPCPDCYTTDLAFIDSDIYKHPDIIIHNNCVFVRKNPVFYLSITEEYGTNFYHLGENHLLMRLLNYIFDNDSNIVLHGAAVGNEDYGVLITGLSGAGKSTLSAYCLANGMKFVGDDRIALHRKNNTVYADPIYTTLSLNETIDGVKTTFSSRPNGCNKDVYVVDKSQISNHIPIKAIIEPIKSGNEKPIIKKCNLAPVLTRICMDYSYFSLLSRNTNPVNDYKKISNLLTGVESFNIELSKDINENAKAICNLILTKGVI
jgi:hypothetical protein